WQQKKTLRRICAQLVSRVRPELGDHYRAYGDSRAGEPVKVGTKRVVYIVDYKGRNRQMTLREPDAVDWEVMTLCWQAYENTASGEDFKALWLGFAGMLLAACQKQSGWFAVGEKRQRHGRHVRKTKLLSLSPEAQERLTADADRWVAL